jgi:hypothetical protein
MAERTDDERDSLGGFDPDSDAPPPDGAPPPLPGQLPLGQLRLPDTEPSLLAGIERPGPTRRLTVGLMSTLPFLGAFAAFETVMGLRASAAVPGGGVSPALLLTGFRRGATMWAPFGVGAALFYALEHELRAPVAALPLPAFLLPPQHAVDRPAAAPQRDQPPLSQYEQLFGRQQQGDDGSAGAPESAASKAAAGGAAALVVSTVLWLRRRRGFRSLGSVVGTAAGCALAAPFMPGWADVEKRSPL